MLGRGLRLGWAAAEEEKEEEMAAVGIPRGGVRRERRRGAEEGSGPRGPRQEGPFQPLPQDGPATQRAGVIKGRLLLPVGPKFMRRGEAQGMRSCSG